MWKLWNTKAGDTLDFQYFLYLDEGSTFLTEEPQWIKFKENHAQFEPFICSPSEL